MPTPIPIIAASSVAKFGVERIWEIISTNARPIPMPNRAVMIGRPMARTDPNTTSRMMMAATMPISSVAPSDGLDWNIAPPSSTWSAAWRAPNAICLTASVVWDVMSLSRLAKSTVAYATVPSFETWRAPGPA